MNVFRLLAGHPGALTLNRYVDRALRAGDMRSVSQHLIACERCRRQVTETQALTALLKQASHPPLSVRTLEAIRTRRAGGERVILPAEDTASQPMRRIGRAVIAAGILAVVVGSVLFSGRNARASNEGGELRFSPERPTPGQVVQIEYRASERFAGERTLALRTQAMFEPRSAPEEFQDRPPVISRTIMHRGTDGSFRGSLDFPLDAIHLYMVVEDTSGVRLDTRAGKFWELFAPGPDGRPSYAARMSVVQGGPDWSVRYDAARALVTDYPDSIAAWRALAFTGPVAHGSGDTSTVAASRRALQRFDAAARANPRPSPELLGHLLWFSRTLNDTGRAEYWKRRLTAESPLVPLAVQERAVAVFERARLAPAPARRALEGFESLWKQAGPAHPTFLTIGLQSAIASDDGTEISRWGGRYLAALRDSTDGLAWVGRELSRHSVSREEGLRMLRAALRTVPAQNDPRRDLSQTAPARLREVTERHAWTLQHIGAALLARGDRRAALDTLRLSARTGWNVERFRSTATASLAAGDTATAAGMLALIALDPETAPALADTARGLLGHPTERAWRELLARAVPVMRRRLMEMAISRPLQGERIHLTSRTGERRTFANLAGGKPTVVVFGMTLDGNSPVEPAGMERLQRRLKTQGANLVVIGLRQRGEEVSPSRPQHQTSVELYFDEQGEAARAFNGYGFPIYFVVDATGVLRFSYSEPADVLAQAKILSDEVRLLSSSK